MEDKMIVLKQFTHLTDAEILVSLLRSEGVDCILRDTYLPPIFKGISFGGVRVELLEKDLQNALEIMRDFGYLDSEIDKSSDPKEKLSRTMTYLCFIILLIVFVIIFLNRYFNG